MTYNAKDPIELNEYQKKKIKNRMSMDFFKELDSNSEEKKRYSKIFRNQLDILISKLDAQGVMFYGFTINMPFLVEEKNIREKVFIDVEEFINYMASEIELIEFCYISIEVNGRKPKWQNQNELKEGLPYLQGILGVRSIIGKNPHILAELKDVFIMSFYIINIQWLECIYNIKNYWNYIIKENNFKFHRFVNYSNFYPSIYGAIADEELKFEGREAFGQANHFISETINISGVRKKYPNKKTLIIYLLNLYFFNKKYKLFKNKIYEKILNSSYSWKIIDTLQVLKKNNIMIFEYLKSLYPQQLGEIHTVELVVKCWNKTVDDISFNNNYLPEIVFKQGAIEFLDGIYFVSEKKFYKFFDQKTIISNKMANQNCCVYFDIYFDPTHCGLKNLL